MTDQNKFTTCATGKISLAQMAAPEYVFFRGPEEVRITEAGMTYHGKTITDAGEAYRLLVRALQAGVRPLNDQSGMIKDMSTLIARMVRKLDAQAELVKAANDIQAINECMKVSVAVPYATVKKMHDAMDKALRSHGIEGSAELARKASDYLIRNDLIGSPLRTTPVKTDVIGVDLSEELDFSVSAIVNSVTQERIVEVISRGANAVAKFEEQKVAKEGE